MRIYKFNILPVSLSCWGGGGGPKDPPPPAPPPQLAKTPDQQAVRNDTASQNVAQGGGQVQSTLLTGGQGAAVDPGMLQKRTLLGK